MAQGGECVNRASGRPAAVRSLQVLSSYLTYKCTCPRFSLAGLTLLGEAAGIHHVTPGTGGGVQHQF